MAIEPERSGTIPEGIWTLNDERSQPLLPGRQTLWIIKDDQRSFVWTTVIINDEGVRVLTNNGTYDGPPSDVMGAGMSVQTLATGPNSLKNYGKIEGVGDFFENCVVSSDGKRLVCKGEVNANGVIMPFVDDFDWFIENPPSARL